MNRWTSTRAATEYPRCFLFVLLVAATGATSHGAPPRYSLEPIGFSVPTTSGRITGFNDQRQATYFKGSFGNRGFWWTGMLERNLDPGPALSGIALDINADSLAAGILIGNQVGTRQQAAIWRFGVLVESFEQSGFFESNAGAVNDLGVVSGWYRPVLQSRRRLFVLDDGVFTDHGFFPNSRGAVEAMNDNNQIVGFFDGALIEGWLWEDGVFTDLPDLEGGIYSTPRDINNDGLIVGNSYINQAELHAAKWIDGSIVALDEPANALGSQANAVNDAGLIVGSVIYTRERDGERAAVWLGDEHYELERLVANLGDYWIEEASGVNRHGEILATAYSPRLSDPIQVLLIPVPEPTPLALLALSVVVGNSLVGRGVGRLAGTATQQRLASTSSPREVCRASCNSCVQCSRFRPFSLTSCGPAGDTSRPLGGGD